MKYFGCSGHGFSVSRSRTKTQNSSIELQRRILKRITSITYWQTMVCQSRIHSCLLFIVKISFRACIPPPQVAHLALVTYQRLSSRSSLRTIMPLSWLYPRKQRSNLPLSPSVETKRQARTVSMACFTRLTGAFLEWIYCKWYMISSGRAPWSLALMSLTSFLYRNAKGPLN